jgi:hypothetical protein
LLATALLCAAWLPHERFHGLLSAEEFVVEPSWFA